MLYAVIVGLIATVGAVVVFRLLRWGTTPILRRVGFYRYHAPMFFTVPLGASTLDMHLGTTWDVMRQRNLTAGRMLLHCARGLLALCDAADRGEIAADTELRGTMYFLGPDRLRHFGFRTTPMSIPETVAFLLNYAEVCLLQRLIKGRWGWVDLRRVYIVRATIADVLLHRTAIATLAARLEATARRNVTMVANEDYVMR